MHFEYDYRYRKLVHALIQSIYSYLFILLILILRCSHKSQLTHNLYYFFFNFIFYIFTHYYL